eukprot:4898452-Amphidinium_carterae.1
MVTFVQLVDCSLTLDFMAGRPQGDYSLTDLSCCNNRVTENEDGQNVAMPRKMSTAGVALLMSPSSTATAKGSCC